MKNNNQEFEKKLKQLKPKKSSRHMQEKILAEMIKASTQADQKKNRYFNSKLYIKFAIAASILITVSIYHKTIISQLGNNFNLKVSTPDFAQNTTKKVMPASKYPGRKNQKIKLNILSVDKLYAQWKGRMVIKNNKPMLEVNQIWIKAAEVGNKQKGEIEMVCTRT